MNEVLLNDLRPDEGFRPDITEEEAQSIRVGHNGIKGILPARCYYDEEIYKFEVDNILKKHWLYVGAWDWAENPGDYFTLEMFGEPLIVIRGKDGKLNCLVNSCRHRWSKILPEGRGKGAKMLICPYHTWSYNLDGTLRGVAAEGIENLDKSKCSLPRIQVEEWNGLVFINFDPNASSLAEDLAPINEILKPYGLDKYRSAGITTYESDWNYKFSFETGYEAYHHCGVHGDRIGSFMPPKAHRPLMFGKNWGAYAFESQAETFPNEYRQPFGKAPWMTDEQAEDRSLDAIFLGIYPNFISFIQPHQISAIAVQHKSVSQNTSSTTIAIADWCWDRPGADEHIAAEVQFMKDVQDEDTYACEMLERGVRSSFNQEGIVHPKFEPMMTHYYDWFLQHYAGTYDPNEK